MAASRSIAAHKEAFGRMPLKLKGVLARHTIQQSEWAEAVKQFNGFALSGSAATQLLNWNIWPQRTPRGSIEEQTCAFLRSLKVDEQDIASCFDPEPQGDPYRHARLSRSGRRATMPIATTQPQVQPVEVEMLTPEARKHFQLFREPFVNDVQGPQDVFLSADQQYIRESMYQTAKHGGFLAVIGESGSGKSTLRRDLIERCKNEAITFIQPQAFDKAKLSAAMICDAIIADISTQAPRRSLEAKARQVGAILSGSAQSGNSHVLMIEEAHDLNVMTLKILKRFWEIEHGFKKLLAVILIGQPELKDSLDERKNYEAREVIRRCEVAVLESLNGNLEDYLRLKFKRVGRELTEIFDNDAFDAIRNRLTQRRQGPGGAQVMSQMYPLVVNRLVTRAMNEAATMGAPHVNREVIETL